MEPGPRCAWRALQGREAALLVALSTFLTLSILTAAVRVAPARAASARDASEIEQKLNAGQIRALASAQARYREGIAALATGNTADATDRLEAAAALDPDYPDPHFTLARALAFRDPERAAGELGEAFRILARSYAWQRHLLANALTAFIVIWSISLLVAVVGIGLRHLPHLVHVLHELTGRTRSWLGGLAATAMALSPLLWGLGPVPTATVYCGLLSFRFGRREAFVVGLFLATWILLAAGGLKATAPWAGAPSLEEPSLLVDRVLRSGADAELKSALAALEARDPTEPLYPFAAGTLARREGDFDRAERQLLQATALRPHAAWVLVNLGNVYFAKEDFEHARAAYLKAAQEDPRAPEPHYNLAQTYTKQLMFTEANREQSVASTIAFERVRDMSRISAPQLNRTMMEGMPPVEAFWSLARRTAPERGIQAARDNPWIGFVERLMPPSPFAVAFLPVLFLLFAVLGQVLGRSLATIPCSNCQRVVCRRCVHRMQQRAFCDECYGAVKDLRSMEFTRLLLTGRDRRASRRRTLWETATTFLLPGSGQMLRGATLSGFLAILILVTAAVLVLGNGALVPSVDVLPVDSAGWAQRIPLTILFALTYVLTVARYYAKTTTQVPSLTPAVTRSTGRASERRVEGGRG